MIFERTQDDLSSWKNDMRTYEKSKRTKKPFGKSLPHVSHVSYEQIKAQEAQFHPILQTFKTHEQEIQVNQKEEASRMKSLVKHMKNQQKYEKDYDIVNLYSYQQNAKTQPQFHKKLGPIRNAYNVINNQKLPDFYFKGRQLQMEKPKEKKIYNYHKKDYNIVTGQFKEHNQERQEREKKEQELKALEKYWKTHSSYDPVYGKFYDSRKQEEFARQQQQESKKHGKEGDAKLPPSYVYREPLILDYEKPLPQTLKMLDKKEQEKRKKYQLKYVIQDQYGQRNLEAEEKQEKVVKNRIHDGRLLDEKGKQFDIITNSQYPGTRVQKLYGKKPKLNSWEEYIKPGDNLPKPIKSSGFK